MENLLTNNTTYTVTATSKLTGATSSITGVLFGDVHFCSGQVGRLQHPAP